jgi:putative acetyltransferase
MNQRRDAEECAEDAKLFRNSGFLSASFASSALNEEQNANFASMIFAALMHALDLDALQSPGITFWTAWDDADLLGCGALKELDSSHGEIKSMHTAAQHRGCGVAKALLAHIIN